MSNRRSNRRTGSITKPARTVRANSLKSNSIKIAKGDDAISLSMGKNYINTYS